jgi:hypothetical protein
MSHAVVEGLEPRALLSVTPLPRPDHVVIVIEENRSYDEVIRTTPPPPKFVSTVVAPLLLRPMPAYINRLVRQGANFSNFNAVARPSEPNYMILFSGDSQGVVGDDVPAEPVAAPSLGGSLRAAGLSFAGYSEGQPSAGFMGEESGDYVRRHNPWSSFSDVPIGSNLPLTRFPQNFNQLPTVSFIVPNQKHNMHDGDISGADAWLKQKLGAYRRWAKTHNSLLIITWDEANKGSKLNHIPTVMVGPMVRHGTYGKTYTHFNLLRTIEDMYDLPKLGGSATAKPITGMWK